MLAELMLSNGGIRNSATRSVESNDAVVHINVPFVWGLQYVGRLI